MKAVIAREFGPLERLDYGDWPEPQATGSTVVIAAEAIGVNYPDGLLVKGLYQLKPQLPFIPGMEVAGRVTAVGPEVKAIRVGDRAAGLLRYGCYAGKVGVPEISVMRLEDAMPAADACALICGYGTSHHALKQRAALRAGETLCVMGAAGATGIAAVQIGKAMGARVVAVASTAAKRAVAEGAGADMAIGYENLKDQLRDITGGKGLDVAFDPVGGETFDALARAMAWNGRLLVIGFASGSIPKFPVNVALLKGFAIVGAFWGAFTDKEPEAYRENMVELLGWYFAGKVRPVIEGVYPLVDAPKILERVLARGATGKLILQP